MTAILLLKQSPHFLLPLKEWELAEGRFLCEGSAVDFSILFHFFPPFKAVFQILSLKFQCGDFKHGLGITLPYA